MGFINEILRLFMNPTADNNFENKDIVGAEPKDDAGIKEILGEGYYLKYEMVSNGFGGYHAVNICMYRGEELIERMTDKYGRFFHFPGVEHGSWEEELKGKLSPAVDFVFNCGSFDEDGLAVFVWMVQPDGRYWADEDGFGMENDMEIQLSAKFDKTGRFVTPFKYKGL